MAGKGDVSQSLDQGKREERLGWRGGMGAGEGGGGSINISLSFPDLKTEEAKGS